MLDKVTVSTIRDTGMVDTHAYNCTNRRCVVVNQNTNRNHLLSNYPTTRTSLCCLKRLDLFPKSQTLFQQRLMNLKGSGLNKSESAILYDS